MINDIISKTETNIQRITKALNPNLNLNEINNALLKINLNKKVKTYKEAEKLIYKINILTLFNINAKTKERFTCNLFQNKILLSKTNAVSTDLHPFDEAYFELEQLAEETRDFIKSRYEIFSEEFDPPIYKITYLIPKKYEAYVLKNKNGYRYYLNTTKRDKIKLLESNGKPSFTLIDLIRIFFNLDFFQAIDYIADKVNITITIKSNVIKMMNDNKLLLNDSKYTELNKLIDNKLFLLNLFFDKSINFSLSPDRYKKSPIFYYPVRKIEEDLTTLCKFNTTINMLKIGAISSYTRILILLGLISTVDLDTLSSNFKYDKKDKLHYSTTAYYVPKYTEKSLVRAEKLAKKINDNNLCTKKLNKENCLKFLGKRNTSILFKNSTNRKVSSDTYNERITKELLDSYNEQFH